MRIFILIIFLSFSQFCGAVFAQSEKPLNLDECIVIAFEKNSTLQNAGRQVKIAGTVVTSAISNILPSVTTGFSKGTYHQSDTESERDVPIIGITTIPAPVFDLQGKEIGVARIAQPSSILGYESKVVTSPAFSRQYNNFDVNVDQNIYDGGAWWNQIKQSRASLRASQYNQTAARQMVARDVSIYYYNLLKAMRLEEVYASAVQVAEEQLKRTESMYEIGSIALVDVYKARVSLGENKINLVRQQNTVRSAKMSLNVVMGQMPETLIDIVDIQKIEIPNFTVEQAVAAALEKNPQLHYYEEESNSASYGTSVAKSRFLPTVGLRFSYTRSNEVMDRVYKDYDKNYNYSFGAGINWNLFNGFADKANLEREQLNYQISKENVIEQRRQLITEIKQAFLEMQAWEEAAQINEENLVAAQEELRLAQEKYRVGSGTLLDVTISQSSVTNAKSTLVQAKYETMMAVARLQAAMGNLKF